MLTIQQQGTKINDTAKDLEEPGADVSVVAGGQSKNSAVKRPREQDEGKPPKKKKKAEAQKKPRQKASSAGKGQKKKQKAEGKILQIVAHDGVTTDKSQPQPANPPQQPAVQVSSGAADQSISSVATQQTPSDAPVPPQSASSDVPGTSGVSAGEPSQPGSPPQQPPALLDVSFNTLSSASSVSPLPPPFQLGRSLTTSPPKPTPLHDTIDSLTLEMEVQDLVDRVTALEEGQAHMLEMQRSILQKQDDILSRLVALENNQLQDRSHRMYSFNDELNFSEGDRPPVFIPPPPAHPAPVCPPQGRLPQTHPPPLEHLPPAHPAPTHPLPGGLPPALPASTHPPPTQHLLPGNHPLPGGLPPALPGSAHPPPIEHLPPGSHPLPGGLSPASAHPPPGRLPPTPAHPPLLPSIQQSSRTPFRQLQPSAGQKRKPTRPTLPSSSIDYSKLTPVEVVIRKYPNLLCESKLPTLAQKLAKEAFFGEAVMVQCTVAGDRDLPGLPAEELQQLKKKLLSIFPQYWNSSFEFEAQWKNAHEAIGQACKRLRSNSKKYM